MAQYDNLIKVSIVMNIQQINQDNSDLVIPLFDLYWQFYFQASDTDSAKVYLTNRLKRHEVTIFVCTDKTENACGFVLLYPDYSSVSMEQYWILNDLFVCSQVRGKGVSKLLINRAHEYCQSSGRSKITLETAQDNLVAQTLYEKLGYREETGVKHYSIRLGVQ